VAARELVSGGVREGKGNRVRVLRIAPAVSDQIPAGFIEGSHAATIVDFSGPEMA
jgi:hypothetical protein